MSETKHSPLPWHAEGIDLVAADRSTIGEMSSDNGLNAEDEANAEFIVRAVNHHGDLVGALQWLLDDLCDADEDKNAQGEYYDSVAHARAALAKAKGTG